MSISIWNYCWILTNDQLKQQVTIIYFIALVIWLLYFGFNWKSNRRQICPI